MLYFYNAVVPGDDASLEIRVAESQQPVRPANSPAEVLRGVRLLGDLATRLARLQDPEALQQTALEQAQAMFRCRGAAICLWDGQRLRHYVYDDNLFDFREDVFEYSVLVTYNGKRFDAPFIRNYLGIELPHAHIDLMSVLRSLGYRGGLKNCERQLGIDRRGLADVDGYFAVLLWWDYQLNGNRRALDTLLAYNALDTVNLETLMVTAYSRKLEQTPFVTTHWLPAPDPPELPFEADRATIDRLKAQLAWD